MFLALLLASALAADPNEITVAFKVWVWAQAKVEPMAHDKLLIAAKDAGYTDIDKIESSRVCSLLYCNVKATGRGVR